MPNKMAKERNGSVADETGVKNGGASSSLEEKEDGLSKGRVSKHDTDSESEHTKRKRKHKSKRRQPDDSYTDSDSDSDSETGSEEDDRKRSGKRSRRAKRKPRRRRNRSYDSDSESNESYSDSESEESEFSDGDSEEEERRRRKRRKERRKEREERERKRRRRDKEKKKREKDRKMKKKKKEKKKEKKAEKGKMGAVTNSWGKYGIIRETDMWNKRPEFTAWLAEVKQVNLESLPNWEEKQMFKQFMEDHNTATFPSKKYYNLDAYYQRQMEKDMKRGIRKVVESERTVFNDEEQRRLELRREREKLKEAEVKALKQSMQSGMAQAMKEQAQLREEMAYQYKLGNFEAAAAIQRRLDPDVAL